MMKATAYASVLSSFRTLLHELIGGETAPSFLVALSGGADSSLLLHLLKDEGYPVAAAHLNHGIRGEEADRDEAFCRALCHTLNVPFFCRKTDVPSYAKANAIGTEEAARELRYAFLLDTVREHGYSYLVTAHNADDNLETVLFHLARGAGLRGLCGIPYRRDGILRPLLGCAKEDILAACEERSIPFVTDSTNGDVGYTRNYLRHEVIPLLRRINPSVSESAFETVRLLREDEAYLSEIASGYSLLDGRAVLGALPDAILSRVLLNDLSDAGIHAERGHLRDAMRAIRSDAPHLTLSLPTGTLCLDRNVVTTVDQHGVLPVFDVPLRLGSNEIGSSACLYLCVSEEDCRKDINTLKNIYKFETKASLASATMNRTLRARSRRPGDTLRMGGMTRSVKKLLQSRKSPLIERNRLPFITDGDQILWIPGLAIADAATPTDP